MSRKIRRYRWSVQVWDNDKPSWFQGSSNIPKELEEIDGKRAFSNSRRVRTTKKLNQVLKAIGHMPNPPKELQVYDIKYRVVHMYELK